MSKKYIVQDSYFKKAKQEGFLARSVYKLEEIDAKFRVFRKNQRVLDLGSFPGSWLQYIIKKSPSCLSSADLQKISSFPEVVFYHGSVFDEGFYSFLEGKQFDVITSDMAPNTTGIFDTDQYASVELNLQVLELMKTFLVPGGVGIFKIFRGEDFNDFWFEAKKMFPDIKTFKPKSCRERSVEIYCVGRKGKELSSS
jgi:23S rRNA (uridine2552-2'-O)-methyltransferase